jgi:serine/threonine protein kinase
VALTPGTRLGPYEIVSAIGAGGMGEVYRATDSNLKRAVAIKVLPAAVAGDADRLARFQREAEVLAALNHPNIAAIYGLEKTPAFTALVMELIEGEDLSQRIARGPIPIDDALPIAKQIADALEAAHEQGIIHRDLKPANVKVRADGTVKVLDFGLAKALVADASSVGARNHTLSPTITSPAMMTGAGMILGTAAYMAPEQARGDAVDRRADIWAFGCVLFEILTGRVAFGAATVTETLAKILEGHPDLSALPATTPPAFRRLLRRCLERSIRTRLQHIGDARADIADILSGELVAESAHSVRAATKMWWLGALALSIAAAIVLAWQVGGDRPRTPTSCAWRSCRPPEACRTNLRWRRTGVTSSSLHRQTGVDACGCARWITRRSRRCQALKMLTTRSGQPTASPSGTSRQARCGVLISRAALRSLSHARRSGGAARGIGTERSSSRPRARASSRSQPEVANQRRSRA